MKPSIKYIAGIFLLPAFHAADAQKTPGKTIEITSTFKPVLRKPEKIQFSASAAQGDSLRPKLQYNVPVQNLAFSFIPVPLKPLAYTDSLEKEANAAYLKLGYGNFNTPYVKTAFGFGDGANKSGNVEADYIASKGKLPYQQYAKYGIKASGAVNVANDNTVLLGAGLSGLNTYRYGYQPSTLVIPKDSLKLNYQHAQVGVGIHNARKADAGLYYNASLTGHFFKDHNDAHEAGLDFSIPLEKNLTEDVKLQIGLGGMINQFSSKDTSFGNNLFLLNAGVQLNHSEQLKLKLGIVPSWNNKQFRLLPDFEADFQLQESKLIAQAGWKGSFQQQTYRSLTAFNPWIEQPDSLNNTRKTEFYLALKGTVDEHLSFRTKLGLVRMNNVFLFLNDVGDGKTFRTMIEPVMNAVNISGELVLHKSDKFDWYNTLGINMYGDAKLAGSPFGLLPMELKSSLRAKLAKGLQLKADLYNYGATWHRTKAGTTSKGSSGVDLSAGLECNLVKKVDLWLQFNNIFNKGYERWNQYPVLGFQALGGVIFRL